MDESCDRQRQYLLWCEGPPPVRVVARSDGSLVELQVHGEADAHTCDQLRRELTAVLDDDVREVRLDVSGLSFCDLAGSDALHDFADVAMALDVAVDLRGMSPLLSLIYSAFPPRGADYAGGRLLHRA